jgi:hypothetical protein
MTRFFTVEEANLELSRLRQWLPRLQTRRRRLDVVQQKLGELSLKAATNGNLLEEEVHSTQREVKRLTEEISKLMAKISDLGCEIKDLDQGLVDFPSLREGREIYLCWRLGEPEVAFWHEPDAGFSGRRPL